MSYLYFAQAGDEIGPVKIGHSADVEKRITQLQTGNHLPVRLLAKTWLEDAAQRERDLHNLLSDDRLEGEWFRFSKTIADVITVHCFADQSGMFIRAAEQRADFVRLANGRRSDDDNPSGICWRCGHPTGSDDLGEADFSAPGDEDIELRHVDRVRCGARQ